MFYFIPSWYNKERKWYDSTALWYRVFERMEFDDTINQVKMFKDSDESTCLLLLNYNPNFRYFLHKYDLADTQYWSFFDEIQNVNRLYSHPIDFKHLNWPKGIHFIYTPFMVVAQIGNERIATIQFAENGNLLHIDFEKTGMVSHRYIFDDRGFLSSILYFTSDGQPSHQDYLNENGVWQVREYLNYKRGIKINKYSDHTFYKDFYNSWEEMIIEFLQRLTIEGMIDDTDCIVVASDSQHNQLLIDAFPNQKKVFSFFNNRYDLRDNSFSNTIQAADLVVAENQETEQALLVATEEQNLQLKSLSRLSPFDTRLRLGHSQTVKELIIYFHIDSIDPADLEEALMVILGLMNVNPLVELNLVSYRSDFKKEELVEQITDKIIKHFDVDNFFKLAEDQGENNIEEEKVLARVQVSIFTNENQIIGALDTARLVLDFSKRPDLYTQIASISAGVPQLNLVETEYVWHKKNGWVLSSIDELNQVLSFYLDGLRNWNESLIYSIQKMNDYTSGRLVKEWKKQLEK